MMTKLRQFSKFFIILIAVLFIGMMVFDWGADITGLKRGDDPVGMINDQKVSYTKFTEMYQQLYEEQRARNTEGEITEENMQQLRDATWERFIQKTLLEDQMEKLGITVSDSEVFYQIYNYPLEDFKQHPSFQTNGVFDMTKYHASFTNTNIPWMQIEDIYRQQIPYIKLQNIVTNTVRVSDEEIRDEYERANLKAKAEFLSISITSFNTPEITASDAEMKAFYDKHIEDYKQNEMRQLAYVIFPINANRADTTRALSEFDNIKNRLAGGEEFSVLAQEYSEDPSVKTNKGDLGYFEHSAMVKPFADAAFNAKPGELVGPVSTSFGFHLIKVEDKKTEDGKEKVKASHILIKVQPAPSRVAEIEDQARRFSEDARENGFDAQAKLMGYTVKNSDLFEEAPGFITGIGRNAGIINFAFSTEPGEISGVYKTEQGYVVSAVTKIQPKGYKDIPSVKRFLENRVKMDKAKEAAREYANTIGQKVSAGQTLNEIAAADAAQKVKYEVSSQFTLDGSVSGVGRFTQFTASAMALEPGQTSGLIETDRAFFYVKLLEKTTIDESDFNLQKDAIGKRLLAQKRNRIFEDWYTALKDKSTILDNRKRFNL
jgi:parvulin-like peptidyl-prolyl isomerase